MVDYFLHPDNVGCMPDSIPVEIGTRFGRWTVTGPPARELRGTRSRIAVPVQCECGTERDVLSEILRRGESNSCGCLAAEQRRGPHPERRNPDAVTKHPLYSIWRAMHGRCAGKVPKSYESHKARGISVCKRWSDFALFVADIEATIGSRPPGVENGRALYSIDRIDNDSGYEPGNLRWATAHEQSMNRRYCIPPEIRAEIRRKHADGQSLRSLGREYGHSHSVIRYVVDGH